VLHEADVEQADSGNRVAGEYAGGEGGCAADAESGDWIRNNSGTQVVISSRRDGIRARNPSPGLKSE
jgi:hypothetical protein